MITSTFNDCVTEILESEGVFSNDAVDPGGKTKYGIASTYHPEIERIEDLTVGEAIVIYRADYWQPAKCDSLPPSLALCVFDSAVNQGVNRSIRFLQSALRVNQDGVIGAITIGKVDNTSDSELPGLLRKFQQERARSYLGLNNSAEERFELGWINRLIKTTVLAMSWWAAKK